jgi:hypothetical protein
MIVYWVIGGADSIHFQEPPENYFRITQDHCLILD